VIVEYVKNEVAERAIHRLEYETNFPGEHMLIIQEGADEQLLVCMGVNHINNSLSDSIWQDIGDTWWFFQESTKGKECVLVGEGDEMEIDYTNSHLEIISHANGEQALLRQLAYENGIGFRSPDKGFPEAQSISPSFSNDDIVLYYFMRYGPQMYRGGIVEAEAVKAYLDARLETLRDAFCEPTNSRFCDFDFSYEHLTQLYEARYGKPFTPLDAELLAEETVGHLFHTDKAPRPGESNVSLISREVNLLRRKNLLLLYEELWREGKSIYSIFGIPHIVDLEDEIRKFGKSLQTIYATPGTVRERALPLGEVAMAQYRHFVIRGEYIP
jgi:hypothetical protein